MLHRPTKDAILVINCGSSSIKFALFSDEAGLHRFFSGAVERIGLPRGRFHASGSGGENLVERQATLANHYEALELLVGATKELLADRSLFAVGHRVVHGGAACDCPHVVTPELEARLRRLIPLAPLHLPHNLEGIAALCGIQPNLPQIACFDTAFHHGLPAVARITTLPREFREDGVRRYGFHGLSYEYVVETLRERSVDVERERIIVAHLGSGASMCALRHGRSLETTMGFSTLAGLMMGTRSGDLDPGAVLYLMTEKGLDAASVQSLLYQRSGLLGVSGVSSDMRELLARPDDPPAQEAVDLFCYRARQHLAGLTAPLGGLDRLVFTGAIGANAAEIRARICDGLSYLGITLDKDANRAGAATISTPGAAVIVEKMLSDEEHMIARHVQRLTEGICCPGHMECC